MSIKENILNLLQEYEKFSASGGTSEEYAKSSSKKKSLLLQEIIIGFAWNPGEFIFVKDEEEKDLLEHQFNEIWNYVEDDIFDVIFWGEYPGSGLQDEFASLVIYEVAERLKRIRPIFSSIIYPDSEFKEYYNEALSAWLFGLNTASLIICWSFLEALIRNTVHFRSIQAYMKISQMDNQQEELLAQLKEWQILNGSDIHDINGLRKLRNKAVHETEPIDSSTAFKAIRKSRTIVEKISLQSTQGS